MNSVLVTGTIRSSSGKPYEGAIVEAWLNSQMARGGSIFGNEIMKTFSNSFGRFSLAVVPSANDQDRENYYTFRIVKDTINTYKKIVSGASPIARFDELPDYIPRAQRVQLLGNVNRTVDPNPVVLPQNSLGMLTWKTAVADGIMRSFSTSGEIHLVALNGVVQAIGIDFVKRSPNTIEFATIPRLGDLIAIQHRV